MSVDQCSNEFAIKWQSTIEAQNHGIGSAKYSHAREWFRNGYRAALKAESPATNLQHTQPAIAPVKHGENCRDYDTACAACRAGYRHWLSEQQQAGAQSVGGNMKHEEKLIRWAKAQRKRLCKHIDDNPTYSSICNFIDILLLPKLEEVFHTSSNKRKQTLKRSAVR